MDHPAASCPCVWTPWQDCRPPEGCIPPQDRTLGRNTLNTCRVEMKEKTVCNWRLPSWVLSSWEVSAWTFRCSSQTVKPLPETDFWTPGLGRWLSSCRSSVTGMFWSEERCFSPPRETCWWVARLCRNHRTLAGAQRMSLASRGPSF